MRRIAIAAAKGGTAKTTTAVTLACGLGHILSSVVLGSVGIVLGVIVARVVGWESFRDRIATTLLIAFGLVYCAWGVQRAQRRRPRSHLHAHADGTVHLHAHVHGDEHSHVHAADTGADASPAARLTPWILFAIFVTGPCEPLIPLLMFPAARESSLGVILVTVVFGATTLTTMLLAVLACQLGLERLPLGHLERYTHALAGAAIALCGLAIQYLGL